MTEQPMDDQHLRLIEAILFASPAPVPERILAGRLPEDTDLAALLEALESRYRGRGVNLVRAGGAWAFRTAPDIASLLNVETWVTRKPSRAQVETLAIIAYHQPATRAEIEEIRGVGMSRGILDTLLEAGWIAPKGRRRTPGRPVTWGTTVAFLDHFGLEDLSHLPGIDEMKAAGLLDPGPAIEAFRKQPSLSQDGGAEAESPDADPGDASEGD